MKKILDIAVIGSGLAALNFADTYTRSGKKINIISFENKKIINKNYKQKIKFLPTQMGGQINYVKNYFTSNNLKLSNNCKVLGTLNFGGLSNYWGLQIDSYINNDQNINKANFESIKKNFNEFLNEFNLIGSYFNKKKLFNNEFKLPEILNSLIKEKKSNFICKKPILGFFSNKKFKNNLNNINEQRDKLNAINFFNKIKKNKKLIFHNFFVSKIKKKENYYQITCKSYNNIEKIILAKKLVLAAGTLVTTKLLAQYLDINNEIKIKHHPRLLSLYFSRKPIKFNLNFTPSLLQIINNSSKDCFSADLRPGNKLITNSIIDVFPYLRPFKKIINFFRHRIIFSNILLDTKDSDIYLRKTGDYFKIYSKNSNIKKILKIKNKKIYKFLKSKKIIFPFFSTLFPGVGADYHYFGSIPFNNKNKLSVNNKCKLKGVNQIYIVDGSVFNFKTNKYPLGIIIANARRIGKYLAKT
jgi:hypothetical protein